GVTPPPVVLFFFTRGEKTKKKTQKKTPKKTPPPPPPPLFTRLTALFLLAALAAPGWAQLLPTARITGGAPDNASASPESLGCFRGYDITLSRAATSNTEFRILLRHVSGYNYFRNHGVEAFLEPGERLNEFSRTLQTHTVSVGQTTLSRGFGFCWPNDIIDSTFAESRFELMLISTPGYDTNSVRRFGITEDDNCSRPQSTRGGIVKLAQGGNLNNTCVCASKSLVEVTPHDGYTPLESDGLNDPPAAYGDIPTYGESSLKWTTDSTNYCPESPYRPGG
ncbi:MAG: hypothetical protein OXD47_02665, partial [Gammaproteobacteria bacterium]|nr:hypothetical protein [Gammaproteobacteria bacterium]